MIKFNGSMDGDAIDPTRQFAITNGIVDSLNTDVEQRPLRPILPVGEPSTLQMGQYLLLLSLKSAPPNRDANSTVMRVHGADDTAPNAAFKGRRSLP